MSNHHGRAPILTNPSFNSGRWTKEEHCRFLQALKLNGRDWRRVQEHVQTRSSTQARSHAQKFFVKLDRKGQKVEEFLASLDYENIEKLDNDQLGFDDDEPNESSVG